ncbi:hypothetical protein ACHAWF_007934 [Thalassiosira exigua]
MSGRPSPPSPRLPSSRIEEERRRDDGDGDGDGGDGRRLQRERLLDESASHGPYLWSGRDVENALLWFGLPSRARASGESGHDAVNGGDDGGGGQDEGRDDGREFLRRMLHARGVVAPRPPPDKLGKASRAKKKKRKRSDLEGDRDARVDDRGTSGRKRPDADDGRIAAAESRAPLGSVVAGYYQLALAPNANNSPRPRLEIGDDNGRNNGDDDGKDIDHDDSLRFSAADIRSAEAASAALATDLASVTLARMRTRDVYEAYSSLVGREASESPTKGLCAEEEACRAIDEYMTSPATCALRAYASRAYDRLVVMCGGRAGDAAGSAVDGGDGNCDRKASDFPGLIPFLRKLFGLATGSARVREAILLLMLEPVRRMQAERRLREEDSKDGGAAKGATEDGPPRDLSPLLTSSWGIISPEELEGAYARPPLPPLIRGVLRAFSKQNDNEAARDKTNRSADHGPMPWWDLPTPLLCAISHVCFPIARECIRGWIKAALKSHDQLYRIVGGRDGEEAFRRAVDRINQFLCTSRRLHLLGATILGSMEDQSQGALESTLSEEEENVAFRKMLAWKAIRRSLR